MILDEKDRLECLKLADAASASHPNKPGFHELGQKIVATALVFQTYISGGQVVQFDGPLTLEQVNEFRRLFKEKYSGAT